MTSLAISAPAPVTIGLRGLRRLAELVYPFAVLGVGWTLLAAVIDNPFALPTLPAVWERAQEMWEAGQPFSGVRRLPEELVTTLGRILWAFAISLAIGVIVGVAIGRVRWVRSMLRPIISFAFPVPKLAIYPALVIVLGFGSSSKLALGVLEGTFPILLASAAAASRVPTQLVWSARSLGQGPVDVARRVVLPAALPGILTGARVGLVGTIIGVFLAEMVVPSQGLGALMVNSYRRIDTPGVYVAVIAIGIIGYACDRTFLAARRRLLTWSTEDD
ncbi:MAG: ABC transporter permease [Actinomycetota bacterium]|nr:ABC transporter permease [Actinomycetota bacterium]